MSTALAILPRIWAYHTTTSTDDCTPSAPRQTSPPVAPRVEFYRKYTEGMLRRYVRFTMEAGRVPSMLGREMFRAKVTSYQVYTFEDVIIFVHDVERCLARLDRMEQLLVTRIALQEYTHNETATMLRIPRRTVVRRYIEAVDQLTAIFLDADLLEPRKECQEGGDRR